MNVRGRHVRTMGPVRITTDLTLVCVNQAGQANTVKQVDHHNIIKIIGTKWKNNAYY